MLTGSGCWNKTSGIGALLLEVDIYGKKIDHLDWAGDFGVKQAALGSIAAFLLL
jgi:hypothetical protein